MAEWIQTFRECPKAHNSLDEAQWAFPIQTLERFDEWEEVLTWKLIEEECIGKGDDDGQWGRMLDKFGGAHRYEIHPLVHAEDTIQISRALQDAIHNEQADTALCAAMLTLSNGVYATRYVPPVWGDDDESIKLVCQLEYWGRDELRIKAFAAMQVDISYYDREYDEVRAVNYTIRVASSLQQLMQALFTADEIARAFRLNPAQVSTICSV